MRRTWPGNGGVTGSRGRRHHQSRGHGSDVSVVSRQGHSFGGHLRYGCAGCGRVKTDRREPGGYLAGYLTDVKIRRNLGGVGEEEMVGEGSVIGWLLGTRQFPG